jgi:hypothetical protein
MNRLMLVLGAGALAAALGTPAVSLAVDRFEPDDDAWPTGQTDNAMTPGSVQEHDMEGSGDQDWIILSQRPFSSYEVRVDGMGDGLTLTTGAGDILAVDLVELDGTAVATGYTMNPAGVDRSVTFANDTATANDDQHLRVSSPNCDPCGGLSSSGYTIRLFDTTYNIARFNNSASQTTVLLLQNSMDRSVDGTVHFFNTSGTLLASHPVTIAAHGEAVVNTPGVPGVAGTAGSMVLTNSGAYGALSGKAVALEPATGFTFDTMMVHRPN